MSSAHEISISDLRQNLAEVLHNTSVYSRVAYVTRNGRRVAAVVPVAMVDQIEQNQLVSEGE